MNRVRWGSNGRIRRLLIDRQWLVELYRGPGTAVAVRLDHPQLPDDAKVLEVSYDVARAAFSILVYSTSFDEVPLGEEIPVLNGPGKYAIRYVDGDRLTTVQEFAHKRDSETPEHLVSRTYPPSPQDATAEKESAREWFQRVMSQPAD